MKLPKLYAPVKIRFSSLRCGVGDGLGVIFDIDTQVERECMRVRVHGGWKWQIKNILELLDWDFDAETDQEILNEYGSEIEVEYV